MGGCLLLLACLCVTCVLPHNKQVAFALGTIAFWQTARTTRLLWAQCYFLFLFTLAVLGTAFAVYYTTTLPQRITAFCDREDESCSDERRRELHGWGLAVGCVGCVLWFVLFSALARHVFVFCVAVERAHSVSCHSSTLLLSFRSLSLLSLSLFLLPPPHSLGFVW
jgi:hypothetical protein